MKTDLRRELMLWAVLLAPLLYLVLVWDQLPEQVPIHWNAAGEVDGWTSRKSLPLHVGGLQLFIYLVLRVLPHIDPRKMNIEASARAYQRLRMVLGLLFGFIGFLMVHSALHQQMDLPRWLVPGLFFLLAALGNYMHSLRSNYFIGIRTPWTLEYPAIWERTHRFAARLWFWCGLLGGVLAFILPSELLPWTMILIGVMTLVPIVHSFLLYRQGVGRTPHQ